jgi:hypothetical protein
MDPTLDSRSRGGSKLTYFNLRACPFRAIGKKLGNVRDCGTYLFAFQIDP